MRSMADNTDAKVQHTQVGARDSDTALQQTVTDAQQTAEIDRLDRRVDRREQVTLAVAIIGVVIAAAAVWVSERQRQIMQRQMNDAREAAVESGKVTDRQLKIAESQAESMRVLAESTGANERARLYVSNVFLSSPGMLLQPGERFKAVVEMGNSGRSAAKHVSSNIVLELLPAGREPSATKQPYHGDYPVPPNTGGVGVEMAFELYHGGRVVGPMSRTTTNAVIAGRLAPFLHGRINYQDIFGEPHWLSICRVWRHSEINAFTGAAGGWRDCSKGEPTDDDARRLTPR